MLAINHIALCADPVPNREECLIEISRILGNKNSGASPFSVLNLPAGSSPDAVTKRYRELSKMFHPDKNPHKFEGEDLKNARDAFVEVANARKSIEDQTHQAANFMNFLMGAFQRRTWAPLFPLKVGKETGVKKNSDVWRGHDSTARYFVLHGKAPALSQGFSSAEPQREARGVHELVYGVAEGNLAPDSEYFSLPVGKKSMERHSTPAILLVLLRPLPPSLKLRRTGLKRRTNIEMDSIRAFSARSIEWMSNI